MCSLILCICTILVAMIQATIAHNISLLTVKPTPTTTGLSQLVADVAELQSNFSIEMESLDYDVFCKFQPNSHSCFENKIAAPEYYYDVKMGDCKTFNFGGCSDAKNVFHYLKECQRVCRESGVAVINHNFPPAVFCRFQPDSGNCGDYKPMFYFDLSTHKCIGFAFTGCGGNQNRFENARDCSRTCLPAVSYKHLHTYDRKI